MICFEPVKYNFERLLESVQFNSFQNRMYVVHAAVGDELKNTTIHVPKNRDDNASLNPAVSIANLEGSAQESENVQMITLDSFFATHSFFDLSNIEFIKIDVQGFEEFVLNGARNLLVNHKRHIVIEAEFSPNMIRMRGGKPQSVTRACFCCKICILLYY